MDKPPQDTATDAPLNPALKSRTETLHDTRHTTPAPIDTASGSEGDGKGWPMVWLLTTAVGIAVALYILI
jgi:hypothetical protein